MEVDSWVMSDTHFGHKNVITSDSRPFEDVAEMDEALIENWNSVVKPGDTIYHLGDFAFYSEDKVCGILERLNYRIHPDDRGGCSIVNGKRTYDRIFIKHKNPTK